MKPIWLILLLLGFGCAAQADRDIVYSARYYAPPGSHRTSHFHLYRINPDGTGRTQLTFGSADDGLPRWSPDGARILFTREQFNGSSALCLVGANGGPATRLTAFQENGIFARWSPNGRLLAVLSTVSVGKTDQQRAVLADSKTQHVVRRIEGVSDWHWAPDIRLAYLTGPTGDRVLNVSTGQTVAVPDPVTVPVWRGTQTIAGLAADPKTERYFLRFLDTQGREKQRLPLNFPNPYAQSGSDDPALEPGRLEPRPGGLIYGINYHNSTVGVDWAFFRLDLPANTMHYLTEGQFLAWSPDRSRFCTAPGRDTTPYEKRRFPFAVRPGASAEERADAEYRTVWFAPLYIRAASGGSMRALTPRLSYVTSADWRNAPPTRRQ
jgi:hypothetical protein